MKEILEEFPANQKELIHALHVVQAEFGYIPSEAISAISKHLKVSESEIYGVLTFYKAFKLTPLGKHVVTICMGTACHVRGAPRILEEFSRQLDVKPGETSEDKMFTLETVNCLGCCAIGPVVTVDGNYYSHTSVKKVDSILGKYKKFD